MPLHMVENRQLLYIVSMFMIVQFAGLLLASQFFSGIGYTAGAAQAYGSGSSGLDQYLALIIIAIVVSSAVLLLLFRFVNTDRLFMLLEIWIVGWASFILFLVLFGSFTGNAFNVLFGAGPSLTVFILAALCTVALVAAKLKWKVLRNVTAMVASIGAGLALGVSFPFWFTMAFMTLLAVYDFIAVFITKHMITLANAAMSRDMSMMIMVNEVEAVPLSSLGKKEKEEYAKVRSEIASKNPALKGIMSQGMVPIPARTALGTGDLMAPLMIAISAYTVYQNFTLSIVVVLGSVLGLCITMYVLKKYRRPLPAIPFLLFGIAVALAAFFLATLI